MAMSTSIPLVRVSEELNGAHSPMFLCTECGQTFLFANVTTTERYEGVKMVGTEYQQRPSFCLLCGAKNKVTR